MNTDQAIQEAVLQRRQLDSVHENCLCMMVKKDYKLIPEQQELLEQGAIFRLTRDEACKLLEKYVADSRRLAEENHLALFEVDNPEELLRKYFRTWSLSDEAEMKLFELDPSGKLAADYSKYNTFSEDAEVKFMTLPNLEEDQAQYVRQVPLSTKTREVLLDLTQGEQFIRQEMEARRTFADSTQVKMLTVANAHEWMKRYTYYAELCTLAQLQLFNMKKPRKMLRLYESRHGLGRRPKAKAKKLGLL